MKRRVQKKNCILFVAIQGANEDWIHEKMNALGYPKKRGKSEFIDDLLTDIRNRNLSRSAVTK